MDRAVFLDRDNTLIANDGDLGDPALVRLVEGVAPALVRLRDAGYRLIVVTNQAGVARGRFGEADVDAVHERIDRVLGETAGRQGLIDRFYSCPYHPEGTIERYRRNHPWRKPHPGMLLQAARDMGLDLARSWLIGDQPRDIAAGQAAGCATVLVSRDRALIRHAHPSEAAGTFPEAVQLILRHRDGAPRSSQATTAAGSSTLSGGAPTDEPTTDSPDR
ncbi:MAG: D-glycero-alpha-D-manno-heptose-1,7-bisphosphate 7-phosphatase [Planctomycetota bacterium]